jgi:hypothetical protein
MLLEVPLIHTETLLGLLLTHTENALSSPLNTY